MATNIKGITIEIGGNTQPLQKALSDVNKKGRDLQAELTQINKLLKLDPSSVMLMTQKQNVLGEAIANAASKLETLKEAEVQVQKQFEKGEVTEAQFRALQREIENTTIDMRRYESQLKEVNSTSTTTAEKTEKIGREAENTGGKVSGFAVAAGTALGNLAANALQSVISGFQTLGNKIVETITNTAAYSDEVNTLSAKFKVSTDTIQTWMYQADIVDTEVETIGGSFGKLVRAMDQANKGAEKQAEAFEALGVSIRDDVTGKFRDTEDVFNEVITALGAVEDETQADIYANALFGRSFQDLNPLIAAGGEKLLELGNEAKKVIISKDQLDSLNSFQDVLDKLTFQFKVAAAPLVEALVPALTAIGNTISQKLADPKVKQALTDIGTKLGELALKISDRLLDFLNSPKFDELADSILGLAESAGGAFVTFIQDILPKLIEFFDYCINNQGVVVAALMAIAAAVWAITIAMDANPVGAIILAITAVVTAILWLQANWEEVSAWFMGVLQAFVDFWVGIWNSISGFFTSIWDGITSFFQNAWNGMVNWFIEQATAYVTFWGGIWDGIRIAFEAVWNAIAGFFTNVWNGIVGGFKQGINTIVRGLDTVIGGLNTFIDGINFLYTWTGAPAIPHIPMIPEWHAAGAIFTKATLLPGMDGSIHGVGESGWEAVLPISRLNDIVVGAMKAFFGGSGGNHVEVNIYPRDLSDGQIRRVINVINREWGAAL